MSFNDYYQVIGLIVTLVLINVTVKIWTHRNIMKTILEEDVSALVYSKGWWAWKYSADVFRLPNETYNWIKIRADIVKGVPEELAVMREKVIALEMMLADYDNIGKVELVWKNSEVQGELLIVDFDEYVTNKEQQLVQMELDHLDQIAQQDFIDLLKSIDELEGENNDDL